MLIIFFIVLFIISLLIFAATSAKVYFIESEVVIDKSKDEVFNYVVQLKNQIYYNKWMMADPNIKLTHTGVDGTVGFVTAWQSDLKDVGVGEQEIKRIDAGELIHTELRFEKPFKGVSQVYVKIESVKPDQTKVLTVFDTRTEFPMNLMIPLIKKMLKKDMNQNAQNLKAALEKK
ncbi:SRPBCC family protein [Cytophaga aurantiaca]|uniref:SRPBCC family protein n=1 Tax=Cytophaga aurantiaca TaxID=29530 RepID=UPI00037AFCBA|nr:SRPBCC family protein [Cytophaga aurantiaca]